MACPCRMPAYAYVVSQMYPNVVSQFRVQDDGSLTPLDPPAVMLPGAKPYQSLGPMAVSPARRVLYVACVGLGVCQLRIGPTGELVPLPSPWSSVPGAQFLSLSPDGRTLYDDNGDDQSGIAAIRQYRIAAGGRLVPLTPPAVPVAVPDPFDLALTPDGRYAYAALLNHGVVAGYGARLQAFHVAPGGVLRPIPEVPNNNLYPLTQPNSLVVGPGGRWLYVATGRNDAGDYSGNSLLLYRIEAQGSLSYVGPAGVGRGPGMPGPPGSPERSALPPSPGEAYLDTVQSLIFTPSGKYALAICEESNRLNQVLLLLRAQPNGRLEVTGSYRVQSYGRLTGLYAPHTPQPINIAPPLFDAPTHTLYLPNNFDSPNGAVYTYRYAEDAAGLHIVSGPRVTRVAEPVQIAVVRLSTLAAPAPGKVR